MFVSGSFLFVIFFLEVLGLEFGSACRFDGGYHCTTLRARSLVGVESS